MSDNAGQPPSPTQTKSVPESTPSDNSVLLVCAQASTRITMERYLRSRVPQVLAASSGREALDTDKARLPTVLVIDTALPDIGAEELILKIRQHRNMIRDVIDCSHAKILLMCAPNDVLDLKKLGRLGVVDRLNKPVGLEILIGKVLQTFTAALHDTTEQTAVVGVLDPEARARDYFVRTLQADDVQIVPMKNELDLQTALGTGRVDILLVETIAVDAEPLDFLKQLRMVSPATKVIVCTAFHDKAMNDKMLQFGVTAVLTKPVNLPLLRAKLRELVVACHEQTKAP